jgi:hypothetical protein
MKVILAAMILCGCNTDTMNYLWPTYEYQHNGKTPAQQREYMRKWMKEHYKKRAALAKGAALNSPVLSLCSTSRSFQMRLCQEVARS